MILKALSEAFGVSGNEGEVREIIIEAVKDHVDEVRVDTMGNLITFKRGTGDSPFKVMVAAHMDEVGLMIVHIEKNGLLRFRKVGGIDDRILLSKVVRIGKDKIPGVIGAKPIHLLKKEERKQVVKVEDMVIDIGVSSREEAEKLVKRGDYAAFATPFAELGGVVKVANARRTTTRVVGSLEPPASVCKGKAFDDRAGCAVLIELVQERYPSDLYAVFTVQEEVGLRGARVAAYAVAPDVAFALEGTIADDLPKKKDTSPTTRLGAGPAITIMDRSVIADPRLVKLLVETAKEEGIPYQFKQPLVGGTDAGRIHLTREGVPSTVVSVPCRYIHAPACLLSLTDFENTVRLMKGALARLTSQWVTKSTS